MWITKSGTRLLINDATWPFWRGEGWEPDVNEDAVGDVTAAAATDPDATLPVALDSSASAGTSARRARADHRHTGKKLAAIAAPTGGAVADTQARDAINLIRAALVAHGLTL